MRFGAGQTIKLTSYLHLKFATFLQATLSLTVSSPWRYAELPFVFFALRYMMGYTTCIFLKE